MAWYDLVVGAHDADHRAIHFLLGESKGIEKALAIGRGLHLP
jgi:hypothetical protein